MAQIVLIHGIGQQASTVEEQEAAWLPSLVKGVLASGHPDAAAVAARVAASTGQNRPPLARMAFYGDLFLPAGTQGEEAPASPAAEALAEALAEAFGVALLGRAAVSDDSRLAAEAANALRQADPDRDGVQGLGARARGAVAVLDGNAWLTARIFGALQKDGRTACGIRRSPSRSTPARPCATCRTTPGIRTPHDPSVRPCPGRPGPQRRLRGRGLPHLTGTHSWRPLRGPAATFTTWSRSVTGIAAGAGAAVSASRPAGLADLSALSDLVARRHGRSGAGSMSLSTANSAAIGASGPGNGNDGHRGDRVIKRVIIR